MAKSVPRKRTSASTTEPTQRQINQRKRRTQQLHGRLCWWFSVPWLILGTTAIVIGLFPSLQRFTPFALIASFVPYGIAAWLFAILLGMLAFPHHPSKRASTIVIGIAIAGLVLQASWLAPAFTSSRPARPPTSARLVIASINVSLGQADATEVLAATGESDVLVLVEVTPDFLASLDKLGARQRWPHRIGTTGAGVEGTMLLSRFPLRDSRVIPASYQQWSATAAIPGWGDTVVAAVHPTNPLTSTRRWIADSEAVRAAIRPHLGGRTIVAGDFNATPDHLTVKRFHSDGWRDTADLAAAGWQPTWPAGGNVRLKGIPVPRLMALDHVLVSPQLTAVSHRSFAVTGTDHRGVLAELALAI